LFFSPWLTFRQAREALRDGQPDEAQRLLMPYAAQGYRKAQRLVREVARAYLDRADRYRAAGETDAAWTELLAAEALNTGESRALPLRADLAGRGMAGVSAALRAGQPVQALRLVGVLRSRGVRDPRLTAVEDAAREWVGGATQANRGDFPTARAALTAAADALDALDPADGAAARQQCGDLGPREERYARSMPHLMAAAAHEEWRQVAEAADSVLAVAPEHREVRALRAKAWQALEPASRSGRGHAPDFVGLLTVAGGHGAAAEQSRDTDAYIGPRVPTPRSGSSGEFQLPPGAPLPPQFLLWVDGVGGYLVCLGDRVALGQATADTPSDIPIFAPIAGLHAELLRDAQGGTLIESSRPTFVNGVPAARAVLRPGDRITLGTCCQLVFNRPAATSNTARLDLTSGHRLPWAVNGILLMDQTLVLGTGEQTHVRLPDLPADDEGDATPFRAILHRTQAGLALKCPGKFRVENRPATDRADLPMPASIQTERFTFTLEPIGPRL
jgi:hypothetical protein